MFRTACLTLTVLGLASTALSVFRPSWAAHLGLDVWNLPELERRLAASERLGQELKEKDRIIMDRVTAKDEVIRELMAGRLTLAEAAGHFRRLNDEPRECRGPGVDCCFPGQTETERYYRQVLLWVEIETRHCEPSQAEEVMCRLEADFAAFLEQQSAELTLPQT
jgi:hypothetical protein